MTSAPQSETTKARRNLLSLAEPLLLAALVCYLLYQFLLSHVEGDQAYLLYAAQQMLAGVQLDGPRLIETNPPLIVWFNLIPAVMAQILHIGPVFALRLVVLAMLSVSAAWSAAILRRSRVPSIFGTITAHLLWALTFFLIVMTQPAEFGQREQLLLALFLPYLLALGTGVVNGLSTEERIALGLCAGLAVCFKPQHLATIVCLELFLAIYRRTLSRLWSPELLAAITTGLFYVVAVRVFTPSYISVIMPLLQSTYWALGRYTFAAMVLHVGAPLSYSVLAGAAVWWVTRHRMATAMLTGSLLASAVGATLAYFWQHTGWYHQSFPAVALFQIAAVWLIADALRGSRPHLLRTAATPAAAWIVAVACGALLFAVVARKKHHSISDANTITAELASYPEGTPVYAFTIGMNAFPVVLDHHLAWGSRFAHLWMLPAIRSNETSQHLAGGPFQPLPAARVSQLADLQRRELTEDLNRTHPQVIFVERCDAEHTCDSFPTPFDAARWFSQDPQFASLWAKYRLQKRLEAFDEYVRQD